jgi:hypothetical protein
MPPKASTLETPRGVGKPQLPPSGDAALDAKRQKNREAAARSRAKAKAATAAGTGASRDA